MDYRDINIRANAVVAVPYDGTRLGTSFVIYGGKLGVELQMPCDDMVLGGVGVWLWGGLFVVLWW